MAFQGRLLGIVVLLLLCLAAASGMVQSCPQQMLVYKALLEWKLPIHHPNVLHASIADWDVVGKPVCTNKRQVLSCSMTVLVSSEDEVKHMHENPFLVHLEMDGNETRKLLAPPPVSVHPGGRSLTTTTDGYPSIPGYDCIKSLEGSIQFLHDLVTRSASIPNLDVRLVPIGNSTVYKQTMWALEIQGKGVSRVADRGIFFAMAGLHPREYLPPELLAQWADYLVSQYAQEQEQIVSLLDHSSIHLILQANPDGRQVAEVLEHRMRRKNLNPHLGCSVPSLLGVDLNRNFPAFYGLSTGSSSSPCAGTYRGTGPASESEVQAIVDYAASVFPARQQGQDYNTGFDETSTNGVFVDVHSWGQDAIIPWGYQDAKTQNHQSLLALAHKFTFWNSYQVRAPEDNHFGLASGATDDYFYAVMGAAAMTLEIADTLFPSCDGEAQKEVSINLDALTYALRVSHRPYALSQGPDIASLRATQEEGDDVVRLSVVVGDGWIAPQLSTSQQQVVELLIWVDCHPLDLALDGLLVPPIVVPLMDTSTTSSQPITVVHDLPLTAFVNEAKNSILPTTSSHVIHVQAKDSDGYLGPVAVSSISVEFPLGWEQTVPPTAFPSLTNAPTPAQLPKAPTPSMIVTLPTTEGFSSQPPVQDLPDIMPSDDEEHEETTTPTSSAIFGSSMVPSSLPSLCLAFTLGLLACAFC